MNNAFKGAQLELLIEDGSDKGAKQTLKDLKEAVTSETVKEIVEAFDSLTQHTCQEAVVITHTHYFA